MKLPPLSSSLSDRLYKHIVEGLKADEPRATELVARRVKALEMEATYEAIKNTGQYEHRWNRRQDGQVRGYEPSLKGMESAETLFCFDALDGGSRRREELAVLHLRCYDSRRRRSVSRLLSLPLVASLPRLLTTLDHRHELTPVPLPRFLHRGSTSSSSSGDDAT
jgi:hypothetical protein